MKRKIECLLLMLALTAALMLSACGSSSDNGTSEAADNATEAVEEVVEEAESPAEVDLTSLDEILGAYEMRPLEIWNTTAEVYEEDGVYVLHIIKTDGEYFMTLEDGNAYGYSPSENLKNSEPDFTYTFEKGVISLTTLDESTTMILKKEGAE